MKRCPASKHDETDEGKQKHAVKMLRNIVNRVLRDLEAHILSETHERRYVLDSTTAMSVLSLLA